MISVAFYFIRNRLHGYQCYCSHMMTEKITKSYNKNIIVLKHERTLSPHNVQGKLHWLVIWYQNSNHKLLFCSKLVGLTPVLFGRIQSVITVPIILRYTVSYSKGETLSEDQSGPWSTVTNSCIWFCVITVHGKVESSLITRGFYVTSDVHQENRCLSAPEKYPPFSVNFSTSRGPSHIRDVVKLWLR